MARRWSFPLYLKEKMSYAPVEVGHRTLGLILVEKSDVIARWVQLLSQYIYGFHTCAFYTTRPIVVSYGTCEAPVIIPTD